MPPPSAPPTLSSTLLLGVLTAAFLLPAALPLDDESEVLFIYFRLSSNERSDERYNYNISMNGVKYCTM